MDATRIMKNTHPAIVVLLTTLVSFSANAADETILFTGGSILTVDEDFTAAEAMAIRGSEILYAGAADVARDMAGSDARVIDLEGRVILPGFIDAHVHPVLGSAGSVFENVGLDRFRDVESALDLMRAHANRPGEWLLFVHLDLATQSFAEKTLTRNHLDKISSDRPVVVWHAGGHKMTVNSVMLERIGVNAETPDPPGAEYGRFADGSPDGNIAGSAALYRAISAIEPFMIFDRRAGTAQLARDWNGRGVTTVGIAGVTSPSDWEVVVDLSRRDDFHLRTRSYLQWGGLVQWDAKRIEPGQGDARARIIGWKISVDGSNQALTGLQREPYLDTDNRGLPYLTPTEIDHAITSGNSRGGQMAMHGNGDAGIDNIIAAVERAREAGIELTRPRIEHCSIVQDDQLADLKRLGISCSFLIAHVLYWGEAFRDRVFGPEKAALLDRTGSFERAGIPWSLHSDYSVSDLSPLQMIEVAVTRRLFTDTDYILAPDERASLEAAVRGVTSVPAWQLMSDHEIGSLEPGKLADFVVLAADPRDVETDRIGEIEVLETWVGGKRIFPVDEP